MPIRQTMVPMFHTTDGIEFINPADALRHQTALDNTTAINEYMDEKELNPRTQATVRNHILGFLAFRDQVVLENDAEQALESVEV